MMKYKGSYRLLPVIDQSTNDFPRDSNGNIEDDLEIYVSCQNGNRIEYYGLNDSRRAVLLAYVPSLGRGRNIKKALKKQGVDILFYDESDEEVLFHFNATDIETVATLLKAKTSGANISPMSKRNLPKVKFELPEEDMAAYKDIVDKVDKNDKLLIHRITTEFLDKVLAKELRPKGTRKPYDYKTEMKKLKLASDSKGYIWTKELWNEYLEFLEKEINSYYNK
jgi:hypothetical protein